jgi:hypothetical protein
MNGVSLANFAVTTQAAIPNFQHAGWWYEYFSGDSINVVNALAPIDLAPGAYRIYTDVKLPKPTITDAPVNVEELFIEDFEMNIFPNPASDWINVSFIASNFGPYELLIINQEGVVVSRQKGSTQEGKNSIEVLLQDLPAGAYHSLLQIGNLRSNKEFIKVN